MRSSSPELRNEADGIYQTDLSLFSISLASRRRDWKVKQKSTVRASICERRAEREREREGGRKRERERERERREREKKREREMKILGKNTKRHRKGEIIEKERERHRDRE